MRGSGDLLPGEKTFTSSRIWRAGIDPCYEMLNLFATEFWFRGRHHQVVACMRDRLDNEAAIRVSRKQDGFPGDPALEHPLFGVEQQTSF